MMEYEGSFEKKISTDCITVCEVAQAHDGSLGFAHAYIDAIAKSGAGAVKFQTHIASAESTKNEPWRIKFSKQDMSRYDYWKRMEFSEEQWIGLKVHAEQKGLLFLSSPFSDEAFDLLMRIGVPAWKIASGEVSNLSVFKKMLDSKLPIILSTGMSSINEIDNLVTQVKNSGNVLVVLQCTSMYPTPPEKIGLNLLDVYKKRYQTYIGLSDHSGTIYPGIVAAAFGASIIEVHVTISREAYGPDVIASITFEELSQLVDGISFIRKCINNPVDKKLLAEELLPTRKIFTKSIVARFDLPAGTVLEMDMLSFKKPGTGLPPEDLPKLVGKKLITSVVKDQLLRITDVEKFNES